jgi:hypothetical protein
VNTSEGNRHDEETADDLVPRDAVRIMLRPVASSLPLGFFAFGTGTVLLSALELGWAPAADGRQLMVMLLAGGCRFALTGVYEATRISGTEQAAGWHGIPLATYEQSGVVAGDSGFRVAAYEVFGSSGHGLARSPAQTARRTAGLTHDESCSCPRRAGLAPDRPGTRPRPVHELKGTVMRVTAARLVEARQAGGDPGHRPA